MDCHTGCPLHRACKVVCCPHCHYSYVEESTVVSLVKRLSGAIGRLHQKGSR
jgi:hypothetical protein